MSGMIPHEDNGAEHGSHHMRTTHGLMHTNACVDNSVSRLTNMALTISAFGLARR